MLGLGLAMALRASSGVASFNPLSLAPRALWDPTNLSSLFQDTAGTTPVTADGQTVARVNDLSGNGFHLVQATGANQPIYRTANGGHLEFDGNRFMNITNSTTMLTGVTAGTALAALAATAETPAASRGEPFGYFANGGGAADYPRLDGVVASSFLTNSTKIMVDPGAIINFHVADWRSEANNFRYSFNGVDAYTTATNTVAVTTGNASFPTIGNNGFHTNHFMGKLGRMAMFNSVLTGTNLSSMRTWVGAGSGVTV